MSDDTGSVEFGFALTPALTGEAFTVTAAVTAKATVALLGMTVIVEGIEQTLPIAIQPGADPILSVKPPAPSGPTGGSATVDLPAITGQGTLIVDGNNWTGGLLLAMSTFSVDAVAQISPGPSFVIVLCARFPPPGIQVGFGFAVSGVGGLFGLNRRADPDALAAATMDGTLSGLLFPANTDDSQRVIDNMGNLFPKCPGQLIVGPMLEITWAGGLLTAAVMVLLELPKPFAVSVLGRLAVDLPTDGAAIVHIEARIDATVIPSVPEFQMAVSLTGSTIAGFPLTGDIYLLIRGGPKATFVFSAGGFHPMAIAPPNVPPMKRLGMTMSLSIIELRCESYVALTTSSVQLGAQVELTALIDGCGIHGNFGFDALIEWEPQFHLRVDVHMGLAVEVFGEHLCGVNFDGFLEGPGPWHLNGRGEVELLFVSVPIPIDKTFGSVPRPPATIPNVGDLLAGELAKATSWTMHPPAPGSDGIILSPEAQHQVAAAVVLHPAGGLQVTEHLLPLGIPIDRFGGYGVSPQCWTITDLVLGPTTTKTTPTNPGDPVPPVITDVFADGTFTTLTVEQQLSTNGFTSHTAGYEMIATDLLTGPTASQTFGFKDIPIDGAAPAPGTGWLLNRPSTLVPLRTSAVTVTIAGNPVIAVAQPPLAAQSDPASATGSGGTRLELWEVQ
jgi:hypothetical protein